MCFIAGVFQEHGSGFPIRGRKGVPFRFLEHPGAVGRAVSKDPLRSTDTDGKGFLRQDHGEGEPLVHGVEIRNRQEKPGLTFSPPNLT